jgi:hypothetical protein
MAREEIDPEILILCGYVRVNQVILGDGQARSFNLVNGWERLAMTSLPVGGEGCALGASTEVTIWAAPGRESAQSWRYDLNINMQGEEISVLVMRSLIETDEISSLYAKQGTLVDLDPPSPLEMLAALDGLDSSSDDGVQDEGPTSPGENRTD